MYSLSVLALFIAQTFGSGGTLSNPAPPPVDSLPGLEKFTSTGNISFLYHLDAIDWTVVILYFGILGIMSIYGIYRVRLVYLFSKYSQFKQQPKGRFTVLPRVTVQLPIFNELYVVERLLETVSNLDYPRELLDIQVLDDSTDETSALARALVDRLREAGRHIYYIHREDRRGFKAGALEEGLKTADGEFIAIFDADFLPRPDAIRKMIDYFTEEHIAVVQMRWSYVNRDYNLLTRIQAIMLDGHLVVEQTARCRSGGFFNFNGTAGMWRRSAIEGSGGWQHDTLTEDSDLSYRAQMMGWKFVYLLDEDVPSELPVEINAFKIQQRRWAKGLIQVGIKLLPRVFRHPDIPLLTKIEMFFRLTGNLLAPLMILLSLLYWPVLICRYNQGFFQLLLLDAPLLMFSTVSVLLYYGIAQRYLYGERWTKTIKYLPMVMAVGIGLVFSNSRAVLEAVLNIRTAFARTPKYRVESKKDSWWQVALKYQRKRELLPLLELGLAAYLVATVYYAAASGIYGTIPFLLLFVFGYGYTGLTSLLQQFGLHWMRAEKVPVAEER